MAAHFSFFYVFFRLNLRKEKYNIVIGSLFAVSAIVAVVFTISITLDAELLFVIPCYFCCIFFFDISPFEGFKYWLITFPGISIMEAAIHYVLMIIFHFNNQESDIISVSITIISLWIFFLLLGRRYSRDIFRSKGKLWIFVALALYILVAMITYFRYVLLNTNDNQLFLTGALLTSVGSLTIFIIMFLIIFLSNLKDKYEGETKILEEYNEQQKTHFERLLKREQNTKKFRHDIDADIVNLRSYLEKENVAEAKNYLSEMETVLERIKRENFSIGNEVIDTLLNFYFQPYIGKCSFSVKGVASDNLKISKRDLSIIISNILKNAIEAVETLPVERRFIDFEINQGRMYLNIKLKNSFAVKPLIDAKSNTLISQKENFRNHGIGLINVNDALKNNDGFISYSVNGDLFITDVSFKIDV